MEDDRVDPTGESERSGSHGGDIGTPRGRLEECYAASWKMMPKVSRSPVWSRLTP